MYDIAIIGGGPAGLTAALYALRANKKVLVLEKATFGGQITYSPKVENYPGMISLSGNELADKLVEQVLEQGAEVEMENAEKIEKAEGYFKVVTDEATHEAKSVIIATGAKHRMLGLERENEFVGEGISFCAVCDGAFFRDKEVAVIGGGNSAMQEALLLAENCKKVYLVQNLDYLTGEEKLAEQIKSKDNVDIILGTVVTELVGENELKAIKIKNEKSGEISTLDVDGMFIAIGLMPQNENFSEIISLNKYGYAESSEDCLTVTDGVFVAGDCRNKKVRQVTTAAADGAVAALAACEFLDK